MWRALGFGPKEPPPSDGGLAGAPGPSTLGARKERSRGAAEATAARAPPSAKRSAPSDAAAVDERHLRMLLDRTAREASETASTPIADASFWAAIDHLLDDGRDRTAIELLRRFAALRPDEPSIAARLVELWCARLEHAEAVPLLEQLLARPAHALRARFLLGEARARAGDPIGARRHYELLLAADLDYPGVRVRHARLGTAMRPGSLPHDDALPASAAVLPTLLGLDERGPGVADRYRLRRELGRGGTGTVYLAFDEELGREVAVKLLHPRSTRAGLRGEDRAQSFNEARLAAALRHPGVLTIYDLDEERGLVAMELCGETLRTRLSRGPLPLDEALARALELCRTLDVVHRAGIVHRDLKPANLLFRAAPPLDGEREALVLGDFGLAHLARATRSPDGAERNAAGTLAYMGPEARRGEMAAPGDVYAAGVVLAEMILGRLPASPSALLQAPLAPAGVVEAIAAALGADPRAPAVLARIARLLAADAAARPDAAEAAALLADAARAQGADAREEGAEAPGLREPP